jgi:hypothetical protein
VGALTTQPGRGHAYTRSSLDNALVFEIENGVLNGKPSYKYTQYEKAPPHHHNVARLFVAGRTPEQIAALYRSVYKQPLDMVRHVLRHPPIAEYITQQFELVREAKEEKLKDRMTAADTGFETLRAVAENEKAPAKVRIDAAKWLAEKDPMNRYTERYNPHTDDVFDTDSLNEFFEHHEQLKAQATDVNATVVAPEVVSCDTPVETENDHAPAETS